jgi:ParB family chromosome partitioning protein
MQEALLHLAIGMLAPDPSQPRRSFLKEEIDRLAASIKARGILQPLRVKRDDERDCWRIVVGECRWRAARLAGLETVPCIEVDGDVSETDILTDQIIENTIRNTLRPLEFARSLAKLKALRGWNSSTLAKETGISGSAVTIAEALLNDLPAEVQAMVDEGYVPESTAYEISRLPDDESKIQLAQAVRSKKKSREQVSQEVRDRIGKKKSNSRSTRLALRSAGVSVNVTASEALTWEALLATIDRIRQEGKKLKEGGKPVTDLAKALKD